MLCYQKYFTAFLADVLILFCLSPICDSIHLSTQFFFSCFLMTLQKKKFMTSSINLKTKTKEHVPPKSLEFKILKS